jgi:hypothetical protein
VQKTLAAKDQGNTEFEIFPREPQCPMWLTFPTFHNDPMPNDRSIPSFLYGTAWKEHRPALLTERTLRAGFRAIDTANQRRHYFEAGAGEGLVPIPDGRSSGSGQTRESHRASPHLLKVINGGVANAQQARAAGVGFLAQRFPMPRRQHRSPVIV